MWQEVALKLSQNIAYIWRITRSTLTSYSVISYEGNKGHRVLVRPDL